LGRDTDALHVRTLALFRIYPLDAAQHCIQTHTRERAESRRPAMQC
jgi:hypothetical protein